MGKLYLAVLRWPSLVLYVIILFPIALWSQIQTPAPAEFPYQHLTLEGALALAVVAQYRENRTKEAKIAQLSIDAAVVASKVVDTVGRSTEAVQRLCGEISDLKEELKSRP